LLAAKLLAAKLQEVFTDKDELACVDIVHQTQPAGIEGSSSQAAKSASIAKRVRVICCCEQVYKSLLGESLWRQ